MHELRIHFVFILNFMRVSICINENYTNHKILKTLFIFLKKSEITSRYKYFYSYILFFIAP